jgi:hypothetical protein
LFRKAHSNRLKVVTGLLLIPALIFNPAVQARENGAAQTETPRLVSSQPVTAGAVMKEYFWTTANGPARIFVLETDLKNPHVQVDVIPGAGKITQRLNVSAMVANTGAVAAVNGDFFNTQAEGAPIGPMVTSGRLASSPSRLIGTFALGITADRKAHIEAFTFEGRVRAPNGREFILSGLNKTTYWEEPQGIHSHMDKLHLYNDLWGGRTRGHDSLSTPTELLISGGRVADIAVGRYFDFAVPEGMQILRGHGGAAIFLLDNFRIGDPVDINYTMSPARNWSMVVGGHALLVSEGKAVPYTKDISALGGVRARTAAGVSRDGTVLFLVSVEGRTADSAGLTLANLSLFLESIGVWRAVNLDGGGSTTMVARPLGEFSTVRMFAPEQANERNIVNAIGIFSTAPRGSLQGFLLKGQELLLAGEEAVFSVRAYDQFFNPVDTAGLAINWSAGTAGVMQDNRFRAEQPGIYEVTVSSGNVVSRLPVEVVGKKSLGNLTLTAGNVLRLDLTTISGKSRRVGADLVDWQFHGLTGHVSPQGILTVAQNNPDSYGFVVARYRGFSAPLVLQPAGFIAVPTPSRTLVLTVGQKELSIDGVGTQMDVAPVIVNGRTLVPVRFISEALEAGVLWDGNTKNATVVRDRHWIDLWPGDDIMVVDGKRIDLDVPPQLINGRTMLPLRAVSQALNLTVDWNPATRQITLR